MPLQSLPRSNASQNHPADVSGSKFLDHRCCTGWIALQYS